MKKNSVKLNEAKLMDIVSKVLKEWQAKPHQTNEGLQEGPGHYTNASNYSDKPDIPDSIEKKVVKNPTGYWVGRPETRYAILKNGFNPKFLSSWKGLLGGGFYFSLDPVDPATVKKYGGEILKVYVPGQYIAYNLGNGYRFVVRPEDADKIQIIDDEDNSSPYGGSGEKWTSTTSVPMTEAQLRKVVSESIRSILKESSDFSLLSDLATVAEDMHYWGYEEGSGILNNYIKNAGSDSALQFNDTVLSAIQRVWNMAKNDLNSGNAYGWDDFDDFVDELSELYQSYCLFFSDEEEY